MKKLRVTMPDGSKWDVPADLIAQSRALHYSDGEPNSEEYRNEYDYTIKDDSELKDWAANNMNWKDVSLHAKRVASVVHVNFQEGWVNGEKEIVDVPI